MDLPASMASVFNDEESNINPGNLHRRNYGNLFFCSIFLSLIIGLALLIGVDPEIISDLIQKFKNCGTNWSKHNESFFYPVLLISQKAENLLALFVSFYISFQSVIGFGRESQPLLNVTLENSTETLLPLNEIINKWMVEKRPIINEVSNEEIVTFLHETATLYMNKMLEIQKDNLVDQCHYLIEKAEAKINAKFVNEIDRQMNLKSSEIDWINKANVMIDEALEKYSADQVGLPDFASASLGGSVVKTNVKTFDERAGFSTIFDLFHKRTTPSTRLITEPTVFPGLCYPFHGDNGQFIIKLAASIFIYAVTLDHIPVTISPSGHIRSAPKEFQIMGLLSPKDIIGVNLGTFEYSISGPAVQTFFVKQVNTAFLFTRLDVINNHGEKYTCIYRFRVHGTLESKVNENAVETLVS